MLNSFTRFIDRNLAPIMISLGLVVGGGFILHDKWEEEKERQALLDKIAKSDATTLACPSAQSRTDIVMTVAPLLEMEDRTMHMNGEEFLRHTTEHGISFAFCPLAAGTTQLDVTRAADGQALSVLKINDQATDQQQQAAILQFLKEYKEGRVSIHFNAKVDADPVLTRAMPGRLPAGTNIRFHDMSQYGQTLKIPSR